MSAGQGKARQTLGGVVRRAHQRMAWLAVALAGVSLILAGMVALRVYIDNNLRLVGRAVAYTVEAAVVFGDADAARTSLSAMLSGEGVAEGRVVDARGDAFATWSDQDRGVRVEVGKWLAQQLLTQPAVAEIRNGDRLVGRVLLHSDGQGLLGFLGSGVAALLACMAISGAVGYRLSRRMARDLVAPLQELAEVARAARHERELALRVPPAQLEELRALGSDFNALLEELQQRQTQLRQQNSALAHQALHDSLTGLPNRACFEQSLQALLGRLQEGDRFAVLFLDNDHFKQVNDTHGHETGDLLLVTVAQRIRAQLRETDLVARLGGDEFAVLVNPLRSGKDASRVADKILQAMAPPLVLANGTQLKLSVSIGVAIYPIHGQDMADLVRAADAAMYLAKADRRGSRRIAAVRDV